MNKEQDKAEKNRKRRERYHESVKNKEGLNEKRRKRDAAKSKNEKKMQEEGSYMPKGRKKLLLKIITVQIKGIVFLIVPLKK